jgi:hypothetical protein
MTATAIQNERTAMNQKVTNQPDGPGLRILSPHAPRTYLETSNFLKCAVLKA